MINREWIRNLADAQYLDGKWVGVPLSTNLATRALDQLQSSLTDAIQIFNQHSPLHMGLFPLVSDGSREAQGLLIVRGNTQIQMNFVRQDDENETVRLVGKLVSTDHFSVNEAVFTTLTAEEDAFGSIGWRQPQKALWSTEQVIRKLLVFILEKSNQSDS